MPGSANPTNNYSFQHLPQFQELRGQYLDEFQPATPAQKFLVNTLAECDWLKNRLLAADREVLAMLLAETQDPQPLAAAYRSDLSGDGLLREIFRETATVNRTFFQTLARLQRMQPARHTPTPQPEAQPVQPQPSAPSAGKQQAKNPEPAAQTPSAPVDDPIAALFTGPPKPFNPALKYVGPPLPPLPPLIARPDRK